MLRSLPLTLCALAVATVTFAADTASAQNGPPPRGEDGERRGPPRGGPRGGPGGGPPGEGRPGGGRFGGPGGPGGFGGGDRVEMMRRFNPLFAALDADEDGEISTAEIDNASAALKTLDKDGNGSVSMKEMRPARWGGPGGPGGPSGDRGPREGRRGEGRRGPGGRGGDGPRGDGPGGRGDGGPARGPEAFMDRLKAMDVDGDGVVSGDELPEGRGKRMLQFGDTNGDGKLDSTEMKAMADRAGSRTPKKPE